MAPRFVLLFARFAAGWTSAARRAGARVVLASDPEFFHVPDRTSPTRLRAPPAAA